MLGDDEVFCVMLFFFVDVLNMGILVVLVCY